MHEEERLRLPPIPGHQSINKLVVAFDQVAKALVKENGVEVEINITYTLNGDRVIGYPTPVAVSGRHC